MAPLFECSNIGDDLDHGFHTAATKIVEQDLVCLIYLS